MKATELMINDLVWYVDEPIKVKHNYGKSIRYDDDSKFSHEVEQSYIKPISLTEDILKANDFEKSGEYYIHRIDDSPSHYDFKLKIGGVFKCEGFSISCGIYILTIKYVHELQHALRLCKLDELADNFKVN